MTDLLIPPELAAKLAALAQHEQRTIPELLEAMLAQYQPTETAESAPDVPEAAPDTDADRDVPPLGTLARLAYEFDKIGFASGLTDSVERSREILETEFAEYLISKRYQDG